MTYQLFLMVFLTLAALYVVLIGGAILEMCSDDTHASRVNLAVRRAYGVPGYAWLPQVQSPEPRHARSYFDPVSVPDKLHNGRWIAA